MGVRVAPLVDGCATVADVFEVGVAGIEAIELADHRDCLWLGHHWGMGRILEHGAWATRAAAPLGGYRQRGAGAGEDRAARRARFLEPQVKMRSPCWSMICLALEMVKATASSRLL